MQPPDPVKAAMWFLEQGYKVFPVWGVTDTGQCLCPLGAECPEKQRGKHPATAHGFLDATSDKAKVQKFMSNPGTPSYGLVLPPGLIGVDVDGENRDHWDDLQNTLGPLPVTLTIKTADGFHYIYRWPDDKPIPTHLHGYVVRSTTKGYLIGAGSRHRTGVYYDIQRPVREPAMLPLAWQEDTARKTGALGTITVGGQRPEDVVAGQGRHDYLRDKGRYYFGLGLRGVELFAVVDSFNQRFAEPKMREDVERAIDEPALLLKFQTDEPKTAFPSPEQVEAKVKELQSDLPEVINGRAAKMPADIDDWLVTDLLRPRSLAVLASTEGVGKSNMRLELGIRVATGHGALFDTYPMTKAGFVLLFDEENGEREEWQREEAMLASLGLTRDDLNAYNRVSYMGLNLEDPAYRVVFDDLLTKSAANLVILDTAGSMVGEEHGRDFKGVIAFLKSMKEKHECCILLVVHLVKPPRDGKAAGKMLERTITDVMGQWTRAADVLLLVSETDDDNVVLLRVRKRVPRSDITLKRDDPTLPDRWLRVDAKRMPPTVIAKEEHQNILLAVSQGRGTWEQVTGYLSAHGLPVPHKSTMMRHLKAMTEAGLIERDPAGVIALTAEGRGLVPARVSLDLSQPSLTSLTNPPTGGGETGETDDETGVRPSETHEGNEVRPD